MLKHVSTVVIAPTTLLLASPWGGAQPRTPILTTDAKNVLSYIVGGKLPFLVTEYPLGASFFGILAINLLRKNDTVRKHRPAVVQASFLPRSC